MRNVDAFVLKNKELVNCKILRKLNNGNYLIKDDTGIREEETKYITLKKLESYEDLKVFDTSKFESTDWKYDIDYTHSIDPRYIIGSIM